MVYNIHNYARGESYPVGHNDQYINNANNIAYVLQRYSDWVRYRTRWFMRDKNQRIGPEFVLAGKN